MSESTEAGNGLARWWQRPAIVPLARIFVVLVCLTLVATDGWLIWKAREVQLRKAEVETSNLASALASEIRAMRQRMRDAHPVRDGRFDIKQSPGGMIDVEFVVQYLVLSHSGAHPALRGNLGNISLLLRAEEAGLLPADVGQAAANAYRVMRQMQHRARLDEAPTQIDPANLEPHIEAVRRLWAHVLG